MPRVSCLMVTFGTVVVGVRAMVTTGATVVGTAFTVVVGRGFVVVVAAAAIANVVATTVADGSALSAPGTVVDRLAFPWKTDRIFLDVALSKSGTMTDASSII